MRRFNACSVFDIVATLRVVLITAAAVAATTSFPEDIYSSKPEILFVEPDRTPQDFWSKHMVGGKQQKLNDPFHDVIPMSQQGYRQVLVGVPLVLFKYSPQKMVELTKPSFPIPEAHQTQLNFDDKKIFDQNFGGNGRRSADEENSQAKEEYEAFRRALARDRVQPMRRSMRVLPKVTRNKGKEQKVEDLLPLMLTLVTLLDKWDSSNDEKEDNEDGTVGAVRSVTFLLKSLINNLEKNLERNMNEPKKYEENLKEYFRQSDEILYDDTRNTENESKKDIKGIAVLADANVRNLAGMRNEEYVKIPLQELQKKKNRKQTTRVQNVGASIPILENVEKFGSTDTSHAKPFIKVEAEESAQRLADEKKNSNSFLKQPPIEDTDTSVELVNRAFDDVKSLAVENNPKKMII